MRRQRIKEIRTLIVRLGLVAAIVFVGYWGYQLFFKGGSSDEIVLEETPLKVEQIRSILELNTLKFQDEVVVDSVEYYKTGGDVIWGTLDKLTDPDQFKHGLKPDGVKRRLTLIVRGEFVSR